MFYSCSCDQTIETKKAQDWYDTLCGKFIFVAIHPKKDGMLTNTTVWTGPVLSPLGFCNKYQGCLEILKSLLGQNKSYLGDKW